MPRTICCKSEPAFQWEEQQGWDRTHCPECGRQCGPLSSVDDEEKRRRVRLEKAVREFRRWQTRRFSSEDEIDVERYLDVFENEKNLISEPP